MKIKMKTNRETTEMPWITVQGGRMRYLINGDYMRLSEVRKYVNEKLSTVADFRKKSLAGVINALNHVNSLNVRDVQTINDALNPPEVIYPAQGSMALLPYIKRVANLLLGRGAIIKEVGKIETLVLRRKQEDEGVDFIPGVLSREDFNELAADNEAYRIALDRMDQYLRLADPKIYDIHGIHRAVLKKQKKI